MFKVGVQQKRLDVTGKKDATLFCYWAYKLPKLTSDEREGSSQWEEERRDRKRGSEEKDRERDEVSR